jgi:hypothetical protein
MKRYHQARSTLGRQLYGTEFTDTELDQKFPTDTFGPITFSGLPQGVQQILTATQNAATKPVPLPQGVTDPRQYALSQDMHYVPTEQVLERLISSGLVSLGDSVVTPHGTVTVTEEMMQ